MPGTRYGLLFLLLAALQTAGAQELPGLLVKYKMDNTCELTDETAESPLHGVLNDISAASDRDGHANAALAFNLNTSYITLGAVEKLRLAGDKSFSFRIKPVITGADRTGSIFTYGNAIVIGYLEQSSIPKLSLKFGNTQYQVVNLKDQWQTITITFVKDYSSTKSRASIYIDGILSDENEQNKSAHNFADAIALMGPAGQASLTNGFRGVLDDMRIYNRALTATEILNAALPLKLESFAAKRTNSLVELSWKTSAEENFSHFNIQRSINGTRFETIKKVDGGKTDYTAYDTAVTNADVWYRLEMVDNDGRKELSKIIKANRNITVAAAISIFPNPAGEALYLKGASLNYTVTIINATGSLAKQVRMQTRIDVSDLAPGLYHIVIYDEYGNRKLVSKFIKTRSS